MTNLSDCCLPGAALVLHRQQRQAVILCRMRFFFYSNIMMWDREIQGWYERRDVRSGDAGCGVEERKHGVPGSAVETPWLQPTRQGSVKDEQN